MPDEKQSLKNEVLISLLIAVVGAALGVVSKLLDIYTANLGNVFSQMSVWVFLCALISVKSRSPFTAAANVFSFCVGMVAAYYITAELTLSVYSMVFVYGWSVFALCSPILGFCTWYAGGKGAIPKVISAGIILVMLAAAALLFNRVRISDIVFAVLIALILIKKDKN